MSPKRVGIVWLIFSVGIVAAFVALDQWARWIYRNAETPDTD